MAAPIWTGTTSTAFGTNTNWSTSAVPADGDTVTFDGQGTQGVVGSDQSAIEPAVLDVYQSFLYTIGSASTALQIGPVLCRIGLPSQDGSQPAGPSLVNLNFTTDPVTCIVYNARQQGTSGQPCIILTGVNASNTLQVMGGSVGLGTFTPGVACTFSSVTVNGSQAYLIIGSNVTLTTLLIQDGTVLNQSSTTTIDHQGGRIETRGTGTYTNIYAGGASAILSSTGTISNLLLSGPCNCVLSGSGLNARTVTTCTLSGTACKLDLRGTGTSITFSNGIELTDGASASQILTDDSIKVTLTASGAVAYLLIEHHTTDDTLTNTESGSTHTNLGASGAVTLTLPQTAPLGTVFKFNVMAAQELRIDPGAAGAVYINGAKQTDNKYISADDEGEHVTLTADGNGDWIAGPYNGTWSVEP